MFQHLAHLLRQRFGASSAREISISPGADRRIYIRYPCDLAISCRKADEPEPELITGWVRNISRGGISLEVNRPFEVGDLLSVDLAGPGSGGSVRVLAYVVHANPCPDDTWNLGCIFAVELCHDDLEPFAAERALAEPTDKRTWVRFECEVGATYQFARSPEGGPRQAKVINISSTGLGMLVNEPVDVGVLLNVASTGDANNPPFRILATVVRSDELQGRWVIGCTFIRELEEGELQSVLRGLGSKEE